MLLSTTQYIQKIEKILDLKLYLVGGAVRDLLLDKPTKDFDFTTPSTPDQIERSVIKAGYKPYILGKKFGTIGFKFEGELIEVTSFRNENYTNGSRKPEVEFHSDIRLDLERRDFTVNAMAISSKGDLIDLFGGQDDLKNGIIKCVGDPNFRFQEDALRMLRAVRFAGQYEFKINDETLGAIKDNFWRLLDISKERWVMEMDKILSIDKVDYAFDNLLETSLLSILIPEYNQLALSIWQDYVGFSLWGEAKKLINMTDSKNLDIRWAVFLSEIFKPMILANLINQNKTDLIKSEIADKFVEYQNQQWFCRMQVEMAHKTGLYLKFSKNRLQVIEEFLTLK